MKIIGHRGSAGTAPENTLLAFTEAIKGGAYAIELDVQKCSTGELVVIHDPRVDRTTDGSGLVAEMTLDELRALDAGRGEQIPLLPEVLDLAAGRVKVNVELKSPGTAAKTAEILDQYVIDGKFTYDQFLVSSFAHPELMLFQALCPQCLIALIIAHVPANHADTYAQAKIWSLNINLDSVSEEFVQSAHKNNFQLFVYTVNRLDDFLRLKQMGVDGIFTDYPARLCQDKS